MSKNSDDLKAEIWKHFGNYQYVMLATDEEGQPRTRPVTLVNLDQRFWVLTGTNDAKVKQIRKNPKTEFCLLFEEEGHKGYIRAAGLAQIISEKATKARVAKNCSFFDEFWKSPNDPSYTLIELKPNEFEYLRPNEIKVRKLQL